MRKANQANRLKLLIAIVIIALIVAVAIIALVWLATGAVSSTNVRIWTTVTTVAAPLLFAAGFYFGKSEARGVLHGFDKSLDRIASMIGDVVTMRDQSRIAVHNATKAPPTNGYTVVLPGVKDLPPIMHRGITSGQESIDL